MANATIDSDFERALSDKDVDVISDKINAVDSCENNRWLHFVWHDCAQMEDSNLAIAVASQLIRKCSHVDVENNRGQSPLMVACIHGRHSFAQWLLQNGADVEKRDDLHWTPLCYSKAAGFEGITAMLINQYNADTDKLDDGSYFGQIYDPRVESVEKRALMDFVDMLGITEHSKSLLSEIGDLSTLLSMSYDELPRTMAVGNKAVIMEAIRLFHMKNWSVDSIGAFDETPGAAAIRNATFHAKLIRSTLQYYRNENIGSGILLRSVEQAMTTLNDIKKRFLEMLAKKRVEGRSFFDVGLHKLARLTFPIDSHSW